MGLCVAYGCNTESGIHRISMFTFPKDPKRRKLWTDRLNRGQTATKTFAPNSHSKLCIKHFDDNQFIIHPTFAEQVMVVFEELDLSLMQCRQLPFWEKRRGRRL